MTIASPCKCDGCFLYHSIRRYGRRRCCQKPGSTKW